RLFDLLALGGDDHPVGADDRAGGLELWHLLDPHQTHATRRLEREIRVIAERRNRESVFAAHVDQARAFRDLKVRTVDGYFDGVSGHYVSRTPQLSLTVISFCPPSSTLTVSTGTPASSTAFRSTQ